MVIIDMIKNNESLRVNLEDRLLQFQKSLSAFKQVEEIPPLIL